jgi:hypothetical protein
MSGMRRFCVKCLGCALVGLALGAASASAEESTTLGGTGSSPLESPLVVPEAQALLGGESVSDAEEARRSSPEAVTARVASATAYEGLSAEQAAKLSEESFPGLIDHPAGGPPQLPAGQTITGYLSDDAAQVDLGGGKHAVIESSQLKVPPRGSGCLSIWVWSKPGADFSRRPRSWGCRSRSGWARGCDYRALVCRSRRSTGPRARRWAARRARSLVRLFCTLIRRPTWTL